VLLTPGPSHDSPALVAGDVVQGEMPFDLSDLIQPAGEALTRRKQLVTQLGPVLTRLDCMSKKLEVDLPPLVTNANKFLVDGDAVVANFNPPESRERLTDARQPAVSSENLKVVSTTRRL